MEGEYGFGEYDFGRFHLAIRLAYACYYLAAILAFIAVVWNWIVWIPCPFEISIGISIVFNITALFGNLFVCHLFYKIIRQSPTTLFIFYGLT